MATKFRSKHESIFEICFSIFLVLFGIVTISSLVLFFLYFIYSTGFVLLIYTWPIAVGLFLGIFSKGNKSEEFVLSLSDHKKLKDVITDVANKTGMKMPSKVILRDDGQVAVTGLFRKKIIIGIVALKFLDKKDLTAILAHEYGHLAYGDTIFGYFIGKVEYFFAYQEAFSKQNITTNILIIFYLPAFLIFWLLNNFFKITSLWYSRRIEFRADQFASEIVGTQVFANSFMKYVALSDIFNHIVPQQVVHYLRQGLVIKNLYSHITSAYTEENMNKALAMSLSKKSTFFNSHPSESERLENLGIEQIVISFEPTSAHILEDQDKHEIEQSSVFASRISRGVVL